MKIKEILRRSSSRHLIQFVNQWEMQRSKQIMTFQFIVKVLLANILIKKMFHATRTIYLNLIQRMHLHINTELNQICLNITKNLNPNKFRVKIRNNLRAKFHNKCIASVLSHTQIPNWKTNFPQAIKILATHPRFHPIKNLHKSY